MGIIGRPRVYATNDDILEAINAYLSEHPHDCTITGLHLALGLTREGLAEYERRPEFSDSVKAAKLFVAGRYEQACMSKNPTGAIFLMKTMGYSDRAGDTININLSGDGGQPIKLELDEASRLRDIARQLAKQDTERE